MRVRITYRVVAMAVWGMLAGTLGGQSLPVEPEAVYLFGASGQDVFHDVVQHTNGSYAMVGTSSRGANKGDDVLLVLLGAEFQQLHQRQIGRDGDDGGHVITQAADGHLLIGGYTSRPSRELRGSNRYYGKRDGWLLQLNELGQTVREYIAGTQGDDAFIDILPLPQGEIMLVGNADGRVWLHRLNRDWQVVADQKWQYHQTPTTVHAAVRMADGNLYVTGEIRTGESTQIWLACFTDAGNIVWEKTLPQSVGDVGTGIAAIGTDRLKVAGYTSDNREDGFCITLDTQGNQVGYAALGGREADRINRIIGLHNGRAALIGRSQSFERGSRRSRVWVTLLERSGDVEEERFYGSKTTDEGNVLIQTHNGQLIAAGFSSQQVLKSTQGWLAVVSSAAKVVVPDTPPVVGELRVYYPSGHLGQPSARAFLELPIAGLESKGVAHLRARIMEFGAEADAAPLAYLPPLARGVGRTYQVPFTLPAYADRDGLARYRVQLYVGDTPWGDPVPFLISTGQVAAPKLHVAWDTPPRTLTAGQIHRLALVVQNTGKIAFEGVTVDLGAPPTAVLPRQLNVGALAVGEVRRFDLPLQLAANHPSDMLHIPVRSYEGSLAYTLTDTLALPVERGSTAPDAPVSQAPAAAIWLYPNPDHYENATIVWQDDEITIQIKVVSDKPLNKQHFCIEINGEPCPTGAKMDEVSLKGSGNSRTFSQRLRLPSGKTNLRAVIRYGAEEIATEALTLVYSPRKPNLHLISIGIPAVDLKYTAKDARDFALALAGDQTPNEAFGQIFMDTLLREANTTKTEILKTLRKLQYRAEDQQIDAKDLLVIFISSHGLSTGAGSFRIAASDYDNPFLEETTLDFEADIISYLERIPCEKLFFIDACHSGAGGTSTLLDQISGGTVSAWASGRQDVNMVLSCREDEYSYEDERWENGAFTAAIVQTLDQYSADADPAASMTLQALFGVLVQRVPQLVQSKRPKPAGSQHPQMWVRPAFEKTVLFSNSKH